MILNQTGAINLLKKSQVVAIPTETVYGLAAIATDFLAVQKVYKIKNRPADNPLICHFYDFNQVQPEIIKPTAYLELLVKHFSPGPVSYLVEIKPDSKLKIANCGLNTMVFRIPSHPVCRSLLKALNQPLAAPSANTSGKYSGTNPEMIEADLGGKIAGILASEKFDRSEIGLESTILDCRAENQINILRPGIIGELELENFLKTNQLKIEIKNRKSLSQTTPGAKYRHYAPKTKISLFLDLESLLIKLEKEKELENIAILASQKNLNKFNPDLVKINLGSNLTKISQNLYSSFYQLDNLNLSQAFLFLPEIKENSSLAKAVANRVKKAVC